LREGRGYHRGPVSHPEDRGGIGRAFVRRRPGPSDDSANGVMKLLISDFRLQIGAIVLAALAVGGCAAGKAFSQGESAMKAGNLDEAVASFRKAVEASPDNAHYKISLQRAMQAASRAHIEKAHEYEQQDQLEAALGEYKSASEYDPSNRLSS